MEKINEEDECLDLDLGGTGKKKKEEWINEDKERFPELYRSRDSIYPSYSRLAVAYSVISRQRYQLMRFLYAKQLTRELTRWEILQQRALHGVRIHRIFSEGFHISRNELKDPLSHEERRHLEALMNTRNVFGTPNS